MAIYGIGSLFGKSKTVDVTSKFLADSLVGSNWDDSEAPDIQDMIRSLSVGDIIFIKSFPLNGQPLTIKAIGFIKDSQILNSTTTPYLEIGRNVIWKVEKPFSLTVPDGKNNVRRNTIYREFDPKIQAAILKRL